MARGVDDEAADAVRAYLLALNDPDKLVDEKEADKLAKRAEKETDPIDRLRLREQARRLRDVDPKDYEKGFVAHASKVAEAEGIGSEAFKEEGVTQRVLRDAGLVRASRPSRGRRAAKQGGAKRASATQVREAMASLGEFTTAELAEQTGASDSLVRKVVAEARSGGQIEQIGVDESDSGPGRRPQRYRWAG